ncbi:unnamed protein product [Cuscuta campestris]|uniref:Glycosyltransferase n=1 Tax=Cuscuta campestris TaxID=132261 RepID=A0A484N250_9ASTE|nr:unnamed protein product [Cuscuta campestris]
MAENKPTGRRFRVLMLPWLAHGHVVPYLELAKELHHRNFVVHFSSTPAVLASLQSAPPNSSPFLSQIHTVPIHLPAAADLPPSRHTTKDLPRHQIFALCKAFRMSAPAFSLILEEIEPDLVVYDLFQPWAAEAAASRGIPAVCFCITGAASIAFTHHLLLRGSTAGFPFPAASMRPNELRTLRENTASIDPEDRVAILKSLELSNDVVLINTSREIEGKYIDHLSAVLGKSAVPTGSLVRVPGGSGAAEKAEDHEILRFLDGKQRQSTVYISFGSEYYLSATEIHEVAKGLELSGANFVWVVRFPAGKEAKIEDSMPEGFLERVKGRGVILEKWAPQIQILGHQSVGGFVMQCGWNSFLESIHFEIPLIAIPMHSEQFITARMAAELGIATEVMRDDDGRLHGEDIAKAVKIVLEEKEGEEMRGKVKELNAAMAIKGKHGIDDTAALLSGLCLTSGGGKA